MSVNRRIRRNNNIAGLKAQLSDKEQEIFQLSQQMDMQRMYFNEVTKVTTALKDMLMKETGLDEQTIMDKVDEHLAAVEAAELDAETKAEETVDEVQNETVTEIDTDNTELDKEIQIVETEETPIEEVISEVEAKEEAPVKKPRKPRKKKEDKE